MAETKDVKRMISKDLWWRARAQAMLEGKNMRNWLTECIEARLKKAEKKVK